MYVFFPSISNSTDINTLNHANKNLTYTMQMQLTIVARRRINFLLCTSHKSLVAPVFCCLGLVVVSSESPVPQNTNKAAKYTNCAMFQGLKRSTLYGVSSFRNWFCDGMC